MITKKQKYNLGDTIYLLNLDEDYSICKGIISGVKYYEVLNSFLYDISYSFFHEKRTIKNVWEKYIFTNKEDAKKFAYLKFVEICNNINDVVNGKARFTSNTIIKDCLESLQDLNKNFGFQLQIYSYKCKKDLKEEIKRLKKELE